MVNYSRILWKSLRVRTTAHGCPGIRDCMAVVAADEQFRVCTM